MGVVMDLKIYGANKKRIRGFAAVLFFCFFLCVVLSTAHGCKKSEQPQYWEIFKVSGDPYDRGLQHGRHFADKIRSFYTTMLTTSIFPFLNREQRDIADVLKNYGEEPFLNGQFTYQLLLQSAKNLEKFIPQPYIDEMRGIADGSGMSYDEILVLNTFLDTMLAFRGMTFFIKQIQAPYIESVSFGEGLDADGMDNDGDGQTDEAGEGTIAKYESLPFAAMTEVKTDAKIKIIIADQKLDFSTVSSDAAPPRNFDPKKVDANSIRIQLDTEVYTAGQKNSAGGDIIATSVPSGDESKLEVTFTPPNGLQAGKVVSIIIWAGDQCVINDPPPLHARLMRDERIVFSTEGYGKKPREIDNLGAYNGYSQPPSISFALRNGATKDGRPLMAHHYSLLDSNTSHKHAVLFVVKPKESEGYGHAYLGWTGIIYGFTGMNENGLAISVNNSDTLSNPLVNEFLNNFTNYLLEGVSVNLIGSGAPMGIMEREILTKQKNVDGAVDYLKSATFAFGWNVMLADASGGVKGAELRSVIDKLENSRETNASVYGPGDLDPFNKPIASVGGDDLAMASHYQTYYNKDGLPDDMSLHYLIFEIKPQRLWSTFYFRSLRSFFILKSKIAEKLGSADVEGMIELLRTPELVDRRDSMSAVVYDLKEKTLHFSMGIIPATDGEFMELNLEKALQEENVQ